MIQICPSSTAGPGRSAFSRTHWLHCYSSSCQVHRNAHREDSGNPHRQLHTTAMTHKGLSCSRSITCDVHAVHIPDMLRDVFRISVPDDCDCHPVITTCTTLIARITCPRSQVAHTRLARVQGLAYRILVSGLAAGYATVEISLAECHKYS